MERRKPTLSEMRRSSGVTQSTLAREIGRELTTLRNWETGRNPISVIDAERICGVLGCTLTDIDWTRDYIDKHPQA